MRANHLTLLALCAAIASASWAPGALSFEGQKPTASPASGAPPSVSPISASSMSGATTQNAPNANAIQTGGIQANQLSADDSALDKVLYAAIEARNSEDVRNALKSGINLRQDFGYACDTYMFDHNYEAEEKFFKLSSPDSDRASPTATPGHCTKQHFQHALAVADKIFNASRESDATVASLAPFDPERVAGVRYKQPGASRDELVARLKATKTAQDSAFEVLALVDANTPLADKAFYPAYLSKMIGSPLHSPWITRWVMDRYFEALPEIKRARTLKEPSRLAWDAYKAKILAKMGNRANFTVAPYELAVFDPSSIPGGDESYTAKSLVTTLLIEYGEQFRVDYSVPACAQKSNFERNFGSPAQQKGAAYKAAAADYEITQKYLVDKVDSYTTSGLAARPYSQFDKELMSANEQAYSQDQLSMWARGVKSYGAHSLLAFLLEKPEVIAALNNKTTQPGGALPPLNFISTFNYGHTPPTTLRAMLNAGVSPSLRGANGKTAADEVIGTDPQSLWRGQAFIKKDLLDPGCVPAR
jgi:hypothetical protein